MNRRTNTNNKHFDDEYTNVNYVTKNLNELTNVLSVLNNNIINIISILK
jgi:hypothetical protein